MDVKPKNVRLNPGSAVVIIGLVSAKEWNGKRGIILSFDRKRGRYRIHVKGRAKPLSVKLGDCVLEVFAEVEERPVTAAAPAPGLPPGKAC